MNRLAEEHDGLHIIVRETRLLCWDVTSRRSVNTMILKLIEPRFTWIQVNPLLADKSILPSPPSLKVLTMLDS